MLPFFGEESLTEGTESEVMKAVVNLFDIVGLYVVFNSKIFPSTEVWHKVLAVALGKRLLSIALGWAGAEHVTSYGMYFILGASTDELDWSFFRTGISLNFAQLEVIGVAALVWALTRREVSGVGEVLGAA